MYLWLVVAPSLVSAQPDQGVLVFPRHPVYGMLERLETLGYVGRCGLAARPLRRSEIWLLLNEVALDSLRRRDREQVLAYRVEFAPRKPGWSVSRDGSRLDYSLHGSEMSVGPSVLFRFRGYEHGSDYNAWRQVGVEGYGRVTDYLALHARMHAIVQHGSRIGPPAANDPEGGLSGWARTEGSSDYYYDTSEGALSVSSAWGGLWWGKFPLSWGPGRRGQVFLSDKPPSSPQLMFVLTPWRWLRYHFVHAQLESGIVDSATIRHPDSQAFSRFYDKYLVAQRMDIYPTSRLRLAAYQSVVYGARGLDVGYLLPLVDLRHIQHTKADRDNVQLGADLTLWWPRRTALSAALFVDELRTSVMFDEKRHRDWIAFQFGMRAADLWGLWRGTMLYFEYTRVNPFVYDHRYPWSTFATAGNGGQNEHIQYPLGYWLGQNADDLYGELALDVTASLKLTLWAEHTRKAPSPPAADGYAADYRAVPFLSGPVTSVTREELAARWRTRRNIVIEGAIRHERTTDAGGSSGGWRGQLLVSWNVYDNR